MTIIQQPDFCYILAEIGQKDAGTLLFELLEKQGLDPSSLEFSQVKHKKPSILNSSFHFNISHSKKHILVAVSPYEIGVDIEEKQERNVLNLSKKLFSKDEIMEFSKVNDKLLYFYEIWCSKEAYLKCQGTGINRELKTISIKQSVIRENDKTMSDYVVHSIKTKEPVVAKVCINKAVGGN